MGDPEERVFGRTPRTKAEWDEQARLNRALSRNLLSGYTLGTSPIALGALRGLLTDETMGEGIRAEREALKELPGPARAVAEFAGGVKAPLKLLGRGTKIIPKMARVGGKMKRVGQAIRPLERALAPLRGGAVAGAVSGASAAAEEGEDPIRGGVMGGILGAVPGVARTAGRVGRRAAGGAVRGALNLLERGQKAASPRIQRALESGQRGFGVIAGRIAGESTTSAPEGKDVTAQAETERLARRWVNEALMSQNPEELRTKLDALPNDQNTPIMQAVRRRLAEYEQ